ncbi:MAG: MraY family glycosyltransferase [Pseudomonadota bacterium]
MFPTPIVGGLAMFMAVGIALLLEAQVTKDIQVLWGCSAALVSLGVLDDKHGLSVRLRMLLQVFLVAVVITGADGTITHLGSLFGNDILLGMFAIPFSVVAFVGGINAINMIDGADGMAGKMALITMLGVMVMCSIAGASHLLPLTYALTGALIGFLIFNTRIFVRRAWVFMGDAGSMWLGLILGWFMAQITHDQVGAEPALVLWLFGIPLIDTLVVMTRRVRQKVSPFAADRTHIHHVLEHAGFSVARTVLLLSLAQTVLVGIGVIFYMMKAPAALVFWSFVMLITGYYYLLRDCKLKSGSTPISSEEPSDTPLI